MTDYWLSTKRMTLKATRHKNKVVDGAPIIRVFIGQPWQNLIKWLKKQGGFKQERLDK